VCVLIWYTCILSPKVVTKHESEVDGYVVKTPFFALLHN